MTICTGRSRAELLDEWLRRVEYLDDLHRLRRAMQADEQRLGACWKTIRALDDVIANEASKAGELRHLIDTDVDACGCARAEPPKRTHPRSNGQPCP
ncbi:hypothetical protein [Ramlibacter sp. Leaf400]|uniref:hypothetical protein n=1 Tax=Ramlibacter sp. Leaf400 TaxID=1736365 RepID=UPI0007002A01|nr:hypothetical protein [Ramlibacter sp. Leaf400]KQT09528.1 hypothetical protein ASG30_13255 [Ramlibacter sp. Leaf400]